MKKVAILCVILALIMAVLCSCTRSAEEQWQEQFDLGTRYLTEGNYEEAIIAFEAAIEIDPLAADGYMMLADAYIAIGEAEQAAQVLYSGWQNCPDDAQAFIDRLEQIGYIIDEDGELVSIEELEATAFSAYREILDLIYYGIADQWQNVEPGLPSELENHLTYMWWYTGGSPVLSLDEAGYMLIDLNGDYVPELITSIASSAEIGWNTGLIYDMYTFRDGELIRLVACGERELYSLCEGNYIFSNGSAGAADSMFRVYNLEKNTDSLHLVEQVRYYGMDDPENPWFYSTIDTYDVEQLTPITADEAQEVMSKYIAAPLQLTLFSEYIPSSTGNNAPTDPPMNSPESETSDGPMPESSTPEVESSDEPTQVPTTPTPQSYLPVDYLGMTVTELATIYGNDFTYASQWFLGAAKGIYYSDLRVPFVFYYLDPEYQGSATGSEQIIIVELLQPENTAFSALAPGMLANMTYSELLDAGYTGTFYDENSDMMWLAELGETSKFMIDYNHSVSITFYWFNNEDPYSSAAGNVIIASW